MTFWGWTRFWPRDLLGATFWSILTPKNPSTGVGDFGVFGHFLGRFGGRVSRPGDYMEGSFWPRVPPGPKSTIFDQKSSKFHQFLTIFGVPFCGFAFLGFSYGRSGGVLRKHTKSKWVQNVPEIDFLDFSCPAKLLSRCDHFVMAITLVWCSGPRGVLNYWVTIFGTFLVNVRFGVVKIDHFFEVRTGPFPLRNCP